MTTLPIINMNGTSAKSLKEGYMRAIESLTSAVADISDQAPHGRDYQGNAELMIAARKEHFERVNSLNAMIEDFTALAMHAHSRIK